MRSDSWSDVPSVGEVFKTNKGLVAVIGLSLIAGWLYFRQDRRRELAEVIDPLKRAGARVERIQTGGHPLYEVNFSGVRIGEAELRLLGRLPGLHRLDLSRTAITDQELKLVAVLTSVVDLDLT